MKKVIASTYEPITSLEELKDTVNRIVRKYDFDYREHEEEYEGCQLFGWIGTPMNTILLNNVYIGVRPKNNQIVFYLRGSGSWSTRDYGETSPGHMKRIFNDSISNMQELYSFFLELLNLDLGLS